MGNFLWNDFHFVVLCRVADIAEIVDFTASDIDIAQINLHLRFENCL